MTILEKIITAIIIFFFTLLVVSLRYETVVQIYDCNQLHKYRVVPEQIIDECFKLSKPARSISV